MSVTVVAAATLLVTNATVVAAATLLVAGVTYAAATQWHPRVGLVVTARVVPQHPFAATPPSRAQAVRARVAPAV